MKPSNTNADLTLLLSRFLLARRRSQKQESRQRRNASHAFVSLTPSLFVNIEVT